MAARKDLPPAGAKSVSPFAEDAGVVIGLPSGHTETISSEEADELYRSLQELVG